MTIGDNIKTARAKRDMTQLLLAHKIGMSGEDAGAFISRIESGIQEPRIGTLRKIADALKVTVNFLLTGKK